MRKLTLVEMQVVHGGMEEICEIAPENVNAAKVGGAITAMIGGCLGYYLTQNSPSIYTQSAVILLGIFFGAHVGSGLGTAWATSHKKGEIA